MSGNPKPAINGPLIIGVIAIICAVAALSGGGAQSPTTKAASVAQTAPPGPAAERMKLPELTAVEQRETIARIRDQWRSENGEKIDGILGNAAKVAHFFRRGPWEAY